MYTLFYFYKDKERGSVMYKKVVNLPNCELKVQSDSNLDPVLGFGSRINNKRSFLFISKILGKHIPVSPKKLNTTHLKLAKLVNPAIKEDNVLLIGLAETATGLGWGLFEQIISKSKIYIHTTRVMLEQKHLIDFEEEHSHATEQYLYAPKSSKFHLNKINHIVIVDDEITTGNTIKNLIGQLNVVFNKPKISVVTLLNWSNYKKNYKIYALHEGKFTFKEKPWLLAENTVSNNTDFVKPILKKLSNGYGRVGAYSFPAISQENSKLFKKFKNNKILLLGTGEFMFYAQIASRHFHESNTLKIQSTTRSPVSIGGNIKSKISFKDNYYPEINNYLYNVIDKKYDVIIIFSENKSKFDFLLHDQLKTKFNKIIPIYV
jgi:pyrimidine operon attenuation protein/uracil phosphoribosyltransferase